MIAARTAREKQFQAIKNERIKTFHGYTADVFLLLKDFTKILQMKLREDIEVEESGMDFKYGNWKNKDLKDKNTRPGSFQVQYN